MDGYPESRRQHSPGSAGSPQVERSRLHEAAAEGYEYTPQPPALDVTQYSSSPSPSSMMDYTSTGVLNTNSASSGSAVTQLTPNEDASTSKSYTRERIPRDPKHHKNKAAHRLSALSSSGSEPHSAGHEGGFLSASQELSYFKSKSRSPQAPMPEYPAQAIATPEPPYPQEPQYSQSPGNPAWGPNYSGPAYAPYQYIPPPGQQPGLQHAGQQYQSGYGYLDPKSTSLSSAFANHPPTYDPQYQGAEDMAGGDQDSPGREFKLPLAELTGYARIASAITGQVQPGVRPLYRRFEWLHHRLLLHYQDRLQELEAKLIQNDSVDTQERGKRDLSASQREERAERYQAHRQKARIMREIKDTFDKYTQLLTSLEPIQKMPAAADDDRKAYRAFLNRRKLIIAEETEFLRADDLVYVAPPEAEKDKDKDKDKDKPKNDKGASQSEFSQRALLNGFSAGFAVLAVALVGLPDLMSRLIVVVVGVVVIAAISMGSSSGRNLKG